MMMVACLFMLASVQAGPLSNLQPLQATVHPATRSALLRVRGGEDSGVETHVFGADMSQLMSLIINAFYSSKEIFLRELISNAADAIDKIRHQALTDDTALSDEASLHISLIPDADAGTLTIIDSGVGMTKQELVTNLGTIAHSGTKAFMQALQQGQADASLIGQFGVGFYSAFLVAKRVAVYSKSNGEAACHLWQSDASGSFTIEQAEYVGLGGPLRRGTAVVLHLDEEQKELLSASKLRAIVKQHSEFVPHPIRIWEEQPPPPAASPPSPPATTASGEASGATADDGGVTVEDVPAAAPAEEAPPAPPAMGWAVLNEQPPIWLQPASELSDEDYAKFYKGLTHSWSEHLAVKHFAVEGQIGVKGLLYVPKEAPFDMFDQTAKGRGLRLYVRRVFVADNCDELCPEWLAFLKGVIDSDDLPLNVSREMLQQSSRLMRLLRKQVVRKALELLNELAEDEDRYAPFYDAFNKHLKLGVHEDEQHRDKIAALLRFRSSSRERLVSLEEYVETMSEGQQDIYYIAAESAEAAASSPFMEAFNERGVEVLFMVDPIDEYALQSYPEHKGHRFVCISREGVTLPPANATDDAQPTPSEEERATLERLCKQMEKILGPRVQKVILSERLTSSPCVLSTAHFGWSANMERIMRAQALRDAKTATLMRSPRTLELNPRHAIMRSLAARVVDEEDGTEGAEAGGEERSEAGSEEGGEGEDSASPVRAASGGGVEAAVEAAVELLYEAALVGSGFVIEEPSVFLSRVHKLLERDLSHHTSRDLSRDELPSAQADAKEAPARAA